MKTLPFMDTQEALEIVSYKLGLKQGEAAKEDPVLLTSVIDEAIADKENHEPRNIGLRDYMTATKIVNEVRLELEKKVGEEWIAKKAQENGVTQTSSGLCYKVIKKGTGRQCWEEAGVRVHYDGKLMDGTLFDSSYDRGQASMFPLNAVIKGWQEGLLLMTVGSTYQFFIPQDLAYGERGSGSDIPPYSPLFFEVELLGCV